MEIFKTTHYENWYRKLRDIRAQARINVRLRRLELGNAGDIKPVGSAISELRIPYGPGYRIYFAAKGDAIVILLCGDNKSTQSKDIAKAKLLAKELD